VKRLSYIQDARCRKVNLCKTRRGSDFFYFLLFFLLLECLVLEGVFEEIRRIMSQVASYSHVPFVWQGTIKTTRPVYVTREAVVIFAIPAHPLSLFSSILIIYRLNKQKIIQILLGFQYTCTP